MTGEVLLARALLLPLAPQRGLSERDHAEGREYELDHAPEEPRPNAGEIAAPVVRHLWQWWSCGCRLALMAILAEYIRSGSPKEVCFCRT